MTMIRLDVLNQVAPAYFAEVPHADSAQTYTHARRVFGEDRYLTQLLMLNGVPDHGTEQPPQMGKLGFAPRAWCKTSTPASAFDLLQQRRRWVLGCAS